MQRRVPHTKSVIARLALAALATITMLGLGPSLPTVQAALQEGGSDGLCDPMFKGDWHIEAIFAWEDLRAVAEHENQL